MCCFTSEFLYPREKNLIFEIRKQKFAFAALVFTCARENIFVLLARVFVKPELLFRKNAINVRKL